MQTNINGANIAYTDVGKGVPVVFVHGFPLNRNTWMHQIDSLKAEFRIIAPDLRGLGDSDGEGEVTTMAQFADDIHALLQNLKTGPCVLVGHSMGGYVTLAFARQYPNMLKGLVLVGTKSGADSPEAAAARRTTSDKVKIEGSRVVVEAMTPKMLAPGNTDAKMLEQVREFMSRSKPAGVIAALLGMATRPDSTPMLANIQVPTLVITGADDIIIPPAESEKLSQAIPRAALEVIPHAGHLVAFEKPAEFNRAMTAWLRALKA